MELIESFSQVLRRLRTSRELTHEKLAERSGLHPTTLSLLENGKRQPSLTTIFLLAEGLEIEPDKIIAEVKRLRPKVRK